MGKFTEDRNFLKLFPQGRKNDEEPMNVEKFVDLMKQFYELGWMRGSGGAMGCISGTQLIVSPSALQKERIRWSDLFVYDIAEKIETQRPPNHDITVSSCSVLFSRIMHKTLSDCVIHTHSKAANLITQLIRGDSFEISHQEYIKGIYNPFTGSNLRYNDTFVIPIIDNKPSESLLLDPISEVIQANPQAVAVLVRNHGLFVWGPTWEATKIMTECIDYLLDLSIDMIKLNIPLVKEDSPADLNEEKLDYFSISSQ